jgi:hypothetical protein
MWQIYAYLAQDVARERTREAEAVARARRAHELRDAEQRAHPWLAQRRAVRMGAIRRATAATLRGVSSAAGSVARSACDAAARLEGRVA